MVVDDIARLLKKEQEKLQSLGVRSLALFGSTARGEARVGSDVDFLVDFVGAATFDQYMGLKIFLEDLLGCSVDLVTRKRVRPELVPYVEQEARRVA